MPMMETTLYCVYEVVAVAVDPSEQKELVVPALVAIALVADKANSPHHLGNSPRLKTELRITLILTITSLPCKTTLKLPMDGFHRSTILRATLRLWFHVGKILILTPCLTVFQIRILIQHHPPGRTRMSRQHRRTGRAHMILRRSRSI